jgi:hypothetical protein
VGLLREPVELIYDFATDPFWISLDMRKIVFSFLSVYLILFYEAYEWVQREPAVGLLREPVEQQSYLRGRGQHQGRAG